VSRFLNALRLFLLVQNRARFPLIYFGLAAVTVVFFRFGLSGEMASRLLPAFLLGEPGFLGFYLVAAQSYLERNEGSVTALQVTPLRGWEYVAAMVCASALVATGAGIFILLATFSWIDLRWTFLVLLCVPALFLTATLFGFVGFALSGYVSEFTRFIVAAAPVSLLIFLPMLSYFQLVPRWMFAWIPSDAALFSFAYLFGTQVTFAWGPRPNAEGYFLCAGLLVVYNVIALYWAVHVFQTRIRGQAGEI
jgi:hypothetical protein